MATEIVELASDLKIPLTWQPKVARAGVFVRAPWTFAIAMNFALRCASRVLCEVLECEVNSRDDIYYHIEKLPWADFFSFEKSFVVSANASDASVQAPALTLQIKDAIVDSFRRQTGQRPNVEKDSPEVRVIARLHRKTLSVSLDTTGTPLAQRGYRLANNDAPLSELLAAGLLRMTGWNHLCRALRGPHIEKVYFSRVNAAEQMKNRDKLPENVGAQTHSDKSFEKLSTAEKRRIPSEIPLSPELIDPMCGTGTFAIEAALQLLNRHPQVNRTEFSYLSLNLFPNSVLRQMELIRKQVLALEVSLVQAFEMISHYRLYVLKRTDAGDGLQVPVRCFDEDSRTIVAAKKNAEAAGVSKLIQFEVGDVKQLQVHAATGLVVMNPPYGVRLGDAEELKHLYKDIGNQLKKNCQGWQAWILCGNPDLIGSIGLRATRRKHVYNGGIECLWLQYVLF